MVHEKPHHPHWPLAALVFAFVFALGLSSVHEPSTWLSIRAGAKILSAGVLPGADTFSYGAGGGAWSTHSWLADVLFAKLDAWGGPGLLTVLKSAVLAGGFALLLPINHGSPLVAATLLCLGACAGWRGFTETAACFDFLFFALFVRILRPRHRFEWTAPAAVAGLTALWANLHGSVALLALWIVGLKVFKASLRTATRERLGYWAMMTACVFLLSWNPHGWGVVRYVFYDAAGSMDAWRTPIFSLYGVLAAAGFVSCFFTLQQEFVTTLACANVLALSLVLPGLRPLAALAACPLIALALGHFFKPLRDTRSRVARWVVVAAALLLIFRLAVTRPLSPARGYGASSLSGAVNFLSVNGVRGRMFNESESGAELAGRTERLVFIDGRPGLYNATFRREAADWPRLFRALDSVYRFDYAVLRNRRAAAPARVLDEDPGWRLAYADDHALVYLKKTGANALIAAQTPARVFAPNRLWPDALDAALARPRDAAKVLGELDAWMLQAPDCVQAMIWKAYALDRLKMADKADRLLELAGERRGLSWDPELKAAYAFVLEARGRAASAKSLYRDAARTARRLGDGVLAGEVATRLRNCYTRVP
ncbi:MAG: hypothetical protein AAB262_00330 [Elusimicrobiota bacterium]